MEASRPQRTQQGLTAETCVPHPGIWALPYKPSGNKEEEKRHDQVSIVEELIWCLEWSWKEDKSEEMKPVRQHCNYTWGESQGMKREGCGKGDRSEMLRRKSHQDVVTSWRQEVRRQLVMFGFWLSNTRPLGFIPVKEEKVWMGRMSPVCLAEFVWDDCGHVQGCRPEGDWSEILVCSSGELRMEATNSESSVQRGQLESW